MRIVSVVLAAGEGRRIGGPKALLPVAGASFLAHVCRLFSDVSDAGPDTVVAVLGAHAEQIVSKAAIPDGVVTVVNDRWREGMLSSIWRGLDAAEAQGAEAIMVHPVDHPLVAAETIAHVRLALQEGALITAPIWLGRRGHPGGFGRGVFDELRRADPRSGARALLAADPARVVVVSGDPGCVAGIDTPEDYARLAGGAG